MLLKVLFEVVLRPIMLNVLKSLMNVERYRLATFVNWNVASNDKELLARIGFYFIGGLANVTKCFFCNVEIGLWHLEHNPVEEHLKRSYNCPLMHGRETTNEPIDIEVFKRTLPRIMYDTCGTGGPQFHEPNEPMYPEFSDQLKRLYSYEAWPIMMKQRPPAMSEAGFFYTEKGDRVLCFHCGGGLRDWEEMDIPWEQHAWFYEKCKYLKLMKGQKFIDEIIARKTSPPSLKPEVEEKKQTDANDAKMCKVCYTSEYNMVFSPCGHIIACEQCASRVKKCPFCRNQFTSVMRIYFP